MAEIQLTDQGSIIEIIQGGDLTVVMPVENGIEIEKLRFIQLADTPNSYEDAAGKTVTVNEEGNALVFSKTYDSFLTLKDTPNNYDNSANKLVVVNQNGNGLRFINYTTGDLDIEYFTQLADVPNSYAEKANFLVTVTNEEDGLDFLNREDVLSDQANVTVGFYKYPEITINKKGIITAIQEGKPFEFPPFIENQFLIGDGTETPAQFNYGLPNQVIITTTSDYAPSWTFLNRFYDSNGNAVLVVNNSAANNRGSLTITNSNDIISIVPNNNQIIQLGTTSDVSIGGSLEVAGSMTIDSTTTFRDAVIFDDSITVNGTISSTGNISSDGNITAGNNIYADGSITAKENLISQGNTTVGENLAVTGNAQIDGNTNVGGNLVTDGDITGDTLTSIHNTNVGGNLAVTGNSTLNGVVTVNGGVINLTNNPVITATNGIKIDPKSDVVEIINVNPATYSSRITGNNDLITKKYFDDNVPVLGLMYRKTTTQVITDTTVDISIPQYSTVMELNLGVDSNLNPEAQIQIIDSDNVVLFDPNDSPYLDAEGLKIFTNKHVDTANYTISVTLLNYQYGEGTIYATYFEGID